MMRAVIIDDEEISLAGLSEKIKKHCPDIHVLKLFSKPIEAINEISELNPDVVFLDIEMPKMNGFAFLEHCRPVNFEVIFITAYSEYAIDALRISALDFLLKPVGVKELLASIERLKNRMRSKGHQQAIIERQLELLSHYLHSPLQTGKIAVPDIQGLEFVNVSDVVKVKGENVYSIFYMRDGRKVTSSMTLKESNDILRKFGFFRVHKSFIVNLKCIVRYDKGEGGSVLLTDGSVIEISRRNKSEFLKTISM